jgi:hypothetical protein
VFAGLSKTENKVNAVSITPRLARPHRAIPDPAVGDYCAVLGRPPKGGAPCIKKERSTTPDILIFAFLRLQQAL